MGRGDELDRIGVVFGAYSIEDEADPHRRKRRVDFDRETLSREVVAELALAAVPLLSCQGLSLRPGQARRKQINAQ